MRLWEKRNIIEQVVDENNKIVIQQENLYGWQARRISQYNKLIEALELLSLESWVDKDFDEMEEAYISQFGRDKRIIEVDVATFNKLNSYVSMINNKLPLYFDVLDGVVDEQEEHIINIKVPDSEISDLKSLAKYNERLHKILQQFNIDGEFEFVWVDKWSTWYVLLWIWVMTYRIFLAWLKIAKEIFETKKTYYESKQAELDYRASLKQDGDFDKKELKNYIDKRISLSISDKVAHEISSMEIKSSKSEPELLNQIIKATTSLIDELWKWTEFHLSLNPPEYATQDWEELRIDYEYIRKLTDKSEETKALEDQTDSEE